MFCKIISFHSVVPDYWTTATASHINHTCPFDLELFSKYLKGGDVADIGCYSGETVRYLDEAGYNVAGIDINSRQIAKLSKEMPHLEFIVSDARELRELESNKYDGIILQVVLSTIADLDDMRKVLAAAKRKLKEGGILYISDFIQTPSIEKYNAKYSKGKQSGYYYGTHEVEAKENGEKTGYKYLIHHHKLVELLFMVQREFSILETRQSLFPTRSGFSLNGIKIIARK